MQFIQIIKQDIFHSNRNFGLDIVRSIAILLVILAHLGINEELTFGINIGGMGVELFFVLSGFLIGQILIQKLSRPFTIASMFDFWKRRWYRTLPMYYLVLSLKFICIDHSLNYKILVYFLFLQNNFVGIDFMPVTWSLVVEEWFYLILPVLFYAYTRRVRMSPRTLTLFIGYFILVIGLLRFLFVSHWDRVYGAINGNFVLRLDSMMCGVLIAHVKLNYQRIFRALGSFYSFIIILSVYCSALVLFSDAALVPGKIDTLIWTRTIWFLINSVCLALLIPFFEKTDFTAFLGRPLRVLVTAISVFSYGAYLLHLEVNSYLLTGELFSLGWWISASFCILMTFLVSGFLYGLFEKPMTNLRELKVNRVANQGKREG